MQISEAALTESIKQQSVASEANLETATVRLPPELLAYLRETAQKRGVSTGDMVRIALGTQKYLADAVSNGATVQLKSSKGVVDVGI